MIIRVQQKFGTWRIADLDMNTTIADVIKHIESKPACNGLVVSAICLTRAPKEQLDPSSTLGALGLEDGQLLRAEFKRSGVKSEKEVEKGSSVENSERGQSPSDCCIDLTSSPSSCEFLSPHKKRRRVDVNAPDEEVVCLDSRDLTPAKTPGSTGPLRFLTYNVWFDSLECERRTREQLYIIRRENPHFVAFQELQAHTAMFLKNNLERDGYKFYLQRTPAPYFCAIASRYPLKVETFPFENSKMGRGLLAGTADVNGRTVVVATTHLESPIPPFRGPAMMLEQRKAQIGIALRKMKKMCKGADTICVLMGDMNWKDKDCGSIPLNDVGFKDAWTDKMGNDPGFTYDGRENQMLTNYLRARLDRVLVEKQTNVENIRLIGTEAIEGLTYEKRVGKRKDLKVLPVLPSDHFGLLASVAI